jgi:hypothetical protein
MSKYRKVPMTKPHCVWHPRCYESPTKMVLDGENRSLGDYCDAHADVRIALAERHDVELRAALTGDSDAKAR